MNILQMLSQFISSVKQQHGQNFNPQQTVQNMVGANYNSPQEALQTMFQSGRINKQQYDMGVNMLSKMQ